MAHSLYDYRTDERIGPATADQVALSDACIRRGGDGMIRVDGAGRVCAFAYWAEPGSDIRTVFTQADVDPTTEAEP
jgi:hypothetical protein